MLMAWKICISAVPAGKAGKYLFIIKRGNLPKPINLHLLWKRSAAIGTADEVSANSDVEDDKERALKLRRAVDAA